jgi:hypothetical protein
MKRHFYTCLLFAVVVCLEGCNNDVEMVFDLRDNADFFDQGVPNDLKVKEDGSLNVDGLFTGISPFIHAYKQAIENSETGFSTLSRAYIRFTKPIPEADLNLDDDPLSYLSHNSPVQLIDVDPSSPELGRRYPLHVVMTQSKDAYRPSGLLQVIA